MLATPALFFEYEDVLLRQEQRESHGRSVEEIDLLMRNFATLIVPVQVHFQWRPQLSDADDERVLEAAINGRADWIVTHNVRDFSTVRTDFGIRVLRPAEALKEIQR